VAPGKVKANKRERIGEKGETEETLGKIVKGKGIKIRKKSAKKKGKRNDRRKKLEPHFDSRFGGESP